MWEILGWIFGIGGLGGLLYWYRGHVARERAASVAKVRLDQELRKTVTEREVAQADVTVKIEDDDTALTRFNRRGR